MKLYYCFYQASSKFNFDCQSIVSAENKEDAISLDLPDATPERLAQLTVIEIGESTISRGIILSQVGDGEYSDNKDLLSELGRDLLSGHITLTY